AGAVVVLAPASGTAGGELRRAVEDTGAEVVVVLAVAGSVDGVPTGRGLAGEPRVVELGDLAEVQVVAGAATAVTLDPATAEDAVARLTAAVHGVRRVDVTDGVGGAVHAEQVLASTRALLAADGSLVTALVGRGAPPDLGDRLVEGLAASHPAVDVVVLATGAEGPGVEVGVE
ncbi:hypothetical protein ICW40_14435, partial [Actinotalea ferrariae]|uniref:hypothetical protein n=1 Tax=Actinotalea ferrariae TaxID=1386098 RepID=UPI001EBD23B6|nr:hypothetical protein [Actinotalea ferrariae]